MTSIMEKVICVTCPKGCTLEVTRDGETITHVEKGCKRGHQYAQQELTDPRRMVATSVKIEGGLHPLLPVYTAAPFPKPMIADLLAVLREINIKTPVQMDEVILQDALNTGIDILASRGMEMKKDS